MNIKQYMQQLGQQARLASCDLSKADNAKKNLALRNIAQAILQDKTNLLAANSKDLKAGEANSLEAALLDRLELTSARVKAMAEGLEQVAALADPVGEILDLKYQPSGIQVGRMRVPLGVIGIIYESRPNVTADAAALCLKSGNACILRGGSESIHSNKEIVLCIVDGLVKAGLPATSVQMVDTIDRAAVGELITMDRWVDVVVPRGGKSLIELVNKQATIAIIKHLDGICHVYIDDKADHDKAIKIAVNAKVQRYGVCNAMETLLVAEAIAPKVLPQLAEQYQQYGVELRGCLQTCALIPKCVPAESKDWHSEYLAPILSIKVVKDIDEAMMHIARYGSSHTEAIITEDYTQARRFLLEVDSSSVMVNASTRLADGFEYGLGAEIGVSTDKLHARGPVGLEGLTSLKYIVLGDGQVRK